MANFAIGVRSAGRGRRVRVVQVRGEIDAHTFPELQARLDELVHAGHLDIVVDCRGLEYISSAGLGVLKQKALELRRRGGDIRLAGLGGKPGTIMELLGFTRLLGTYPTVASAVRSFQRAEPQGPPARGAQADSD